MSIIDLALIIGVLAMAGCLFYRSFPKRGNPCAGCGACSCGNVKTEREKSSSCSVSNP